MARRNLKSREKVYMQGYQSEDGFKFDQSRPQRRDYITLKNRSTKTKQENQEELLEYYTTEKFNEYFRELTHVKMTYNSQTIQQIKQMHEMVQAGHNICVVGRGSKIDMLKDIHKKLLTSYHTFEAKAYLPSVTQKKICTHFGGYLLDLGLAKNLEKYAIFDQIEEYHNILYKSKTKIVVILHSLDGPQLMNPDSQEKLSCLFDNPFIQLICSLDSMKMVMNWSPITLQKYKFLFFNVDTRQPYIEQLRYRSLKNENKETTEESLMYVWQSLNKNQKQIVKFIAANAIQNINKDESQANYYTFSALLDVCIEQVVLSSDHQLRQNLLQLLDHKIILERTDDKRNKKIYVIKFEKRTLEKVMELKVD